MDFCGCAGKTGVGLTSRRADEPIDGRKDHGHFIGEGK
jgi:hypothetical protein